MDDLKDCMIPDDYTEIPSQIQGIQVFGPKSGKPTNHTPKSYTCPVCRANTQFDLTTAGIACEHCGYTASINAKPSELPAAKHEFTIKTLPTANRDWGIVPPFFTNLWLQLHFP